MDVSISGAHESHSLELPPGGRLALGVEVHSEDEVLVGPLGVLVDGAVVDRLVVARLLLVDSAHVQQGQHREHLLGTGCLEGVLLILKENV